MHIQSKATPDKTSCRCSTLKPPLPDKEVALLLPLVQSKKGGRNLEKALLAIVEAQRDSLASKN
jgi:hypothetical protein